MSQHDYVLDNAAGASFRADANAALAAIVSANSGATEPATKYAYMLWADTTANKLRMRNGANTAWVEVGDLDVVTLGLLAKSGGTLTGALTLSDDADAELTAVPIPECGQFDFVSATQVKFAAFKGDRVPVQTGGKFRLRTITAGGVLASNTALGSPPSKIDGVATNLAPNTTYNAYLRDVGGALELDFSLTGRATDATTGVQIKSGDATRTLIGKVTTDASGQFQPRNPGFSGGTTIGTISWFNKEPISALSPNYLNATFAFTAMTEIDSTKRVTFTTWGGGYEVFAIGVVSNNTVANVSYLMAALDGAAGAWTQSGGHHSAVDYQLPFVTEHKGNASEGQHYCSLRGQVSGGTATIRASGYLQVTVEG